MKLEDAIKALTLLREEHGNIELYISINVSPFLDYIKNGHLAPVSAAEFIVYEPADGSGVEESVVIRGWPH